MGSLALKMDESIESIFLKPETISDGSEEFTEYEFSEKDFIHSVGFFGGSESGKTFLCKDLLSRVRHLFPRVILFSPTAAHNNDFQGIVNRLLIIPELSEQKFVEIYRAQQEISLMYKKINSLPVLTEVFNVACTNSSRNLHAKIIQARDRMIQKFANYEENIAAQKAQELNDKVDRELCGLIKSVILGVRHTLALEDFSKDAQDCIKYLDLQPNTLFIFDDLMDECCAMLKKTKTEAAMFFKNMFTKGRHIHATHWHIVQDDAALPPSLRKNIRTSIFTRGDVANTYITRLSNGIAKSDQKYGLSLIGKLFQSETDYRKLIYLKDHAKTDKFQYYTAKNVGLFCTSSSAVNLFCDGLLML